MVRKERAKSREERAKGREKEGNKEMNEMEYNGLNRGLRSNPADLYVFRKKQHSENTTPAGVAQTMYILHFYKHVMPPAFVVPLPLMPWTSVNGKETAPLTTGLRHHLMWLKPLIFMKSANRQLKLTAIEIHNQMNNFEPHRIQTELKNYPEIQFNFEPKHGFMRCTLVVTAQDTRQDEDYIITKSAAKN